MSAWFYIRKMCAGKQEEEMAATGKLEIHKNENQKKYKLAQVAATVGL